MTEEQAAEFETVVRPVIKWLNDNCHPHTKVIIRPDNAEVLEGVLSFPTDDYLND